jgi:hypothetical protein
MKNRDLTIGPDDYQTTVISNVRVAISTFRGNLERRDANHIPAGNRVPRWVERVSTALAA